MTQPIIAYRIIRGGSPEHLAELVTAALPGAQPFGAPLIERETGTYCQAVVETGGAFVHDGQVLSVEPSGEFSESVTLTVEGGAITAIALD